MDTSKSAELFARAKALLPGGVDSPVRAFGAVGRDPLFIAKAAGDRITDVDGNEYIDYVGTWGPAILGHAHPQVVAAVQKACETAFRSAHRPRWNPNWRNAFWTPIRSWNGSALSAAGPRPL